MKHNGSLNFSRIVTPFLESGTFLLDRLYFGDAADLGGDLDAPLDRRELGHQLGHVSAGLHGLQVTLLHGGVSDDSLHLGVALRRALQQIVRIKYIKVSNVSPL